MAAYTLRLVLLWYLGKGVTGNIQCTTEPKCDCVPLANFQLLLLVNCSGRGLTEVPQIADNSEKLFIHSIDLSRNRLQNIIINDIYPRTIKQLNLSFNNLKNLSENSFSGIPYLEVLDLSNNDLTFSNESLPDHTFQYLYNLKVLNLSFNNFSSSDEYNANLFTTLTSLHTLVIDGLRRGNFNLIAKIPHIRSTTQEHSIYRPSTFVNLTHLTTLIVSGRANRSKCMVKDLTKDFFKSVPMLTYLDMSWCEIKSVDPKSLSLRMLSYLDLSFNEKLTFRFFQNFSIPEKLQTLKLDKIHCTYGIGTYLTEKIVKIFENSSITNLSLASNRLEILELRSCLFLPPNLTNLDVSDNRLTFGRYVLYLPNLKHLKHLHLSGQHSTHFTGTSGDFNECHNLPLCSSFSRTTNISDPIPFDTSMILKVHVPPLLETIDYTKSSLNSEIKLVAFDANNSVKKINLSNNYFESLRGPVYGLDKVEVIDLSYNFISDLTQIFFENFTSVKFLNFSGNLLGKYVTFKKLSYFKTLWNLTELDLSSNGIRSMESEIFEGLESLTVLKLSNNLLRNFSLRDGQLKSLTTLDLAYNELTSFSDNMMTVLESIQLDHPLKIDMTKNEIRCTCDSLDFLKWISKSAITFHFSTALVGKNEQIQIKNKSELDMQIKILVKKCDDYEVIIGVVSALYVVFFACIVGGILYRYRWKLRYIYYMSIWSATTSRKSYSKIYGYDAFVSYADEEKEFVTKEMTSELEDTSGMVLCLHERDFTPGKSIGENITKSICESRKILCVVTEHFLSSQWCMYELEMALTDHKYSRNDQSVFLIIYGGLPTESSKIRSSIRLMSLVERNAYLEYPSDEENRGEFWNSLRAILKNETNS